jgi:serine/threonine-protein kinase
VEVSEQARVIAGRYQLESLIGEGGMASVWRARDLTLERPVAVKLLFARDERDKQRLVQQFVREARIAASVHHRNVIHIVDFGTTEEQQPFMVMELLEGETLGHRMHREPRLTLGEIVHVALLTLRGLSAVHDAGIIHRDLKPDNVFLTRDRGGALFPKILDFGISRSIEPRSGRRSALTTRDGMIVGTPEYMSPEQARGVRSIDRRSDLYSMGCILYEELTGELPFSSENVGDLIIQIVTSSASPVHELNPDVPRALSDLVAKAMARNPADRFQDADEMQNALLAAIDGAEGGKLVVTVSDMPPLTESLLTTRKSQERLRTLEFPLDAEPAQRAPVVAISLPQPITPIVPPPPAGIAAIQASGVSRSQPPVSVPPPVGRPGRGRVLVLAAVALCALGGGGLLIARNASGGTGALAASAEPVAPSAAPAAPADPVPSATITVQLHNVPKEARVSVDGAPAAGDRLELPREQRNRVIRVVAPGKSAWQAVHYASADGSYEVYLVDEPVAAAAAPSSAAQRAQRPATAPARPKPPKKPPSALRKLDF